MSEDEEEEGNDEEPYPEIRLVPRDSAICKLARHACRIPHAWVPADSIVCCAVQTMFEVLCECAALNPDSEEGKLPSTC